MLPADLILSIGAAKAALHAGEWSAAATALERALAELPPSAEGARTEIHILRGLALTLGHQAAAAQAEFEQALTLDPARMTARIHLGGALADQDRIDEARAAYDRALELEPGNGEARFHRSLLLLLEGNFAKGWAEYEARRGMGMSRTVPPDAPEWDGGRFDGETLFLWTEQGLGDAIQFARFLPRVKALGGRVILECRPELARLFREAPGLGIDEVLVRGSDRSACDWQFPLMSLGKFFCAEAGAIPGAPYLPCDRARGKAGWIGIVWAGERGNPRDRLRSIPVERLAPLAKVPGIDWVGLQKEMTSPLFPDGVAGCRDLFETARVIEELELVVTVDTAVAHVAGAMGKPVWILLPRPGCWRWGRVGERSAWYPTARLWRQERREEWEPVIARVAAALRDREKGVG